MTPTLRTERLFLEPYAPADEDDFVALFQDTRVSRWMGDGPESEAADRALFGRIFTKVYALNQFDVWAVRRDGRLVGHAEIKPATVVKGYEIIYALAAETWGCGLGTELADAIVSYGFGTLGLAEVYATVAQPNRASLALLGKIGFQHVRDIKQDDGGATCLLTRSRADAGETIRPGELGVKPVFGSALVLRQRMQEDQFDVVSRRPGTDVRMFVREDVQHTRVGSRP